ncbi:hypothetical protein [Donghicola eburneus]|jgi:hypothetical protein|uniref:ABM domain-containing protein n=1 Tax=Donghicola eburneus TaxID=393278 RepID=A0A1M4MW05_9RHOB|nr:hypothetical protein [Donghicola eburneus]SCM66701.1 hypothetical protein KARMA_0882 [Donghicola eburneus]
MYSKIYQIEVPGLAEGKIAAAFMAEELTPLISRYNMAGLSVFLCKEGMVQITVNFDSPGDMKLFQEAQEQIFAQLKNSFSCSTGEYQAVPVFRYEREATNSSMQMTH